MLPGFPVAEVTIEAGELSVVFPLFARLVEWIPGLIVGREIPTEGEEPGKAELDDPKFELIITDEEIPRLEAMPDEGCELVSETPELVCAGEADGKTW